ncbi:MAG: leucyl/phenylalanyl-tRNA--protein transferase, partial [Clostridia bacterium]|nr:leucyl/phenylalanyl-tRNA--protein transferase [Clostridia bacterium]
MEKAYTSLHFFGFASSVEAYVDGMLAGGLYGVNIGRCFFGESMFSDMPNGSKLALILFAGKLARDGYVMIDCQFHTDHLASMGGVSIPWQEYEMLLRKGCAEARCNS